MYVLHHADTPTIYANLPQDPAISPLVGLWKGVSKPLGAAGHGRGGAGGVLPLRAHRAERVEEDEHRRTRHLGVHVVDPAVHTFDPRGEGSNGHERQPGKTILRYTANQRTNHWLVAILFFMAGLSGLALFHPAMFWLSNLFGGGPWTRILHPFMGVAMFVFFFGLVFRFWRANFFIDNDWKWLRTHRPRVGQLEESVPPIGKYNPGQKMLFWTLLLCMLGLLFTGLVIWRAYFSAYFGITVIRWAMLLHALAGFVLVLSIIIHIYAGDLDQGFGGRDDAWLGQPRLGEETP
jgi:formate dehydrogenase subunit gamma